MYPKNDVINKVVFFPKEYYKGNKSMYQLMEESGYLEQHDQIGNEDISAKLSQSNEVIDLWLELSANKRVSEGWYFIENNPKVYVVGYYPLEKGIKEIVFSSAQTACAYFIKKELDSIIHWHLSR